MRLRNGSPDAFVGSEDAPTTVTDFGSKSSRTRGSDTKTSSVEFSCHTGESRYPRWRGVNCRTWIPACAGMTNMAP
jgi:hypothetical protein